MKWRCPICHAVKLAPSRPRAEDVRRYCLGCSEKQGVLVRRVCDVQQGRRDRAKAPRNARHRRTYVFQAPDAYFFIGGIDARKLADRWFPGSHSVRVRATRQAGPVTVSEHTVTLRKGPWADRFDAEAQAAVGAVRAGAARARLWGGSWSPARIRTEIRKFVEWALGVRPRLDRLSRAEIEVATLLRKQAALAMLGEATKRKTA